MSRRSDVGFPKVQPDSLTVGFVIRGVTTALAEGAESNALGVLNQQLLKATGRDLRHSDVAPNFSGDPFLAEISLQNWRSTTTSKSDVPLIQAMIWGPSGNSAQVVQF